MANIFDLINPRAIAAYWNEVGSNKIPYLGATLFPPKKQLGLDLSWFRGSDGLPIELAPAAFDTKSTFRDRIGVSEINTEMPFFKDGFFIKEKDRIEINKAIAAANADYVEPIIRHIYDDAVNLVKSSDVTCERMRMQLLSGGVIAISANRQAYNYDYKFPEAHKETLLNTAKWSDTANSDPISDILRWQKAINDDTGVTPTRGICRSKTWNYLLANQKIKQGINAMNANGANVPINNVQLQNYLSIQCNGLRVAVYDKMFRTLNGTKTAFFPDDVFTLHSDGSLGNTYYGTTPEESDMLAGTNANVQIVNTGVAIKTIKQADPVNVQTIASMIAMPSFEAIDNVFIAKVNG